MCLIDNKRFRFTFKRIPVYKIVVKNCGEFFTPFEGALMKKYMHGEFESPYKDDTERYRFEEGFIHAFTSKKAAEDYACYSDVIIEGYIPAFTRYAISNDLYAEFTNSICARRMVFPTLSNLK